jgi:hypothetical protein
MMNDTLIMKLERGLIESFAAPRIEVSDDTATTDLRLVAFPTLSEDAATIRGMRLDKC